MIAFTIEWFRAAYHGLGEDGKIQWPPSPTRLLAALTNGAYQTYSSHSSELERGLRSLQTLSESEPPIIFAPQTVALNMPPTYAPQTWVPEKLSNSEQAIDMGFFNVANSLQYKPVDALALSDTHLVFTLPDSGLLEETITVLNEIAAAVSYFGRSHDPAIITVEHVDAPFTPEWDHHIWYPSESGYGKHRGWLPNTMEWLNANFERIFSPEASISRLPPLPPQGYTRTLSYSTRASVRLPEDFSVVALPYALENHRIPKLFRMFNTQLPAKRSYGLIPLTISGSAHADGRCVGVGITPRLNEQIRTQELAEASEVVSRMSPTTGRFRVNTPGALNPRSWVGPSREWRSTTPYRGYPDIRVVEHVLREEISSMFSMGITILEAQKDPVAQWHSRWTSSVYEDGFADWWLTFRCDEEITGPVALGASNHDGYGMFQPAQEKS